MKSIRFLLFCIVFVFLIQQAFVYSSSSGVTNATRKYGPSGCSCHSGTYVTSDTSVKVIINGPDSLLINTTGTYTVTVSGGAATRSGVNIAISSGTLSTNGSTILKFTNSELTHRSPVAYTNGSAVYTFQYKAPASADSVIMYAAGSSGKAWNFADDKVIHVVKEMADVQLSNESKGYYLLQNYPNPFNPATKILYSISADAMVTLSVYSVSGKLITTLGCSFRKAGKYSTDFNGASLPSGVYLCKMEAHELNSKKTMTQVCKIVLSK
jgi:hypothetical protein